MLKAAKRILAIFFAGLKDDIRNSRNRHAIKKKEHAWERWLWSFSLLLTALSLVYFLFIDRGDFKLRLAMNFITILAINFITNFIWKKYRKK